MPENWRRLLLGGFAVIALLAAGLLVARRPPTPTALALIVNTPVPARPFPTRQPTPRDIAVYVSGAVTKPGVYTLRPGSRAQDAVTAAGGALADADLDPVNLAAPVNDGEQLAVPRVGEPTPVPTTGGRSSSPRGATPTPQGNWLLNINTASAADFRAIPGIGKVTADRLVAYRQQNGPFASVDELVKAGLHQTVLTRIRARLTVQ